MESTDEKVQYKRGWAKCLKIAIKFNIQLQFTRPSKGLFLILKNTEKN